MQLLKLTAKETLTSRLEYGNVMKIINYLFNKGYSFHTKGKI